MTPEEKSKTLAELRDIINKNISLEKELSKLRNVMTKSMSGFVGINLAGLSIGNICSSLKIDLRKQKIQQYKKVFKNNNHIINDYCDNNSFIPVDYMIMRNVSKCSICDEEVILFYYNKINSWKEQYKDDSIDNIIDEIKFNLKYGNPYAICALTSTLIECLLNQKIFNKGKHKYKKIKKILKAEVFKPLEIEYLYEKFIENNLYADTKDAEILSRHTTHGEGLELINMESAMNIILIYDFIQSVLDIKIK